MLSLTKKTEYGLMALVYLTRADKKICSAREISDYCQIPLPLLMNVLKTLAQDGMVSSTRGAKGGYRLAIPATRITLLHVLRILEGPLKLVQCVGEHDRPIEYEQSCGLVNCCTVRSPLLKIHDELNFFLDQISIANLAEESLTPLVLPRKR